MLFDRCLSDEQLACHPLNGCRLGKRIVGDQGAAQHHKNVEFTPGQPRRKLGGVGHNCRFISRFVNLPNLDVDQPTLAESQLVSRAQDPFGIDLFSVDVRAVAATYVAYRPGRPVILQDGVQARDGWVVLERHHIGRGLAEGHSLAAEWDQLPS